MIKSVQIVDPTKTHIGWWDKIEALKAPRTFTFKPGLNILWGKNGSGKSTLLKALARVFHCEQSGFPVITQASLDELAGRWRFNDRTGYKNLPKVFKIKHDGQAVRHFDPSHAVGLIGGAFDWDFGEMGIVNTMTKASSGQTTLFRFDKLIKQMADNEVPELEDRLVDRMNDVWNAKKDVAMSLLKATKGVPKGQPTVLLDEPERSFDLRHQMAVWRLIRSLSTQVQFIVASHSLFALDLPEAHYIEMDPGYLEEAQTVRKVLMTFPDEKPLPTEQFRSKKKP